MLTFHAFIDGLNLMEVELSDLEVHCLLNVLQRDLDIPGQGGIIVYKDLLTLIKNFVKKEKLILNSEQLGLNYRVLTQPTFAYLLKLKQIEMTSPLR